MRCEEVRELLSAVVDGEATPTEGEAVDAHLASCPECRAWRERVHTLQRWSRVRGYGAEAVPDAGWLASLLHDDGGRPRSRSGGDRVLLALAAAALLLLTVPQVLSGHVDDVRDVAALEVAVGVALVVVLLQPWRAGGVAAVAAPAGALLIGLEVYGLVAGGGSVADLVRHLAVFAGGLTAWRVSRDGPPVDGDRAAGMAIGALWWPRRRASAQ